ncbi:MAG: hypothetical protein BGO77_07725 [Caedibacter sp. 37-49]|nr:MAG: hypothetical protein BGO77_07725 [Caedibacter sp. 37-49]
MRLFSAFLIYSFSTVHASLLLNIELQEESKHTYSNIQFDNDLWSQEEKQVTLHSLEELEKCFNTASQSEIVLQRLILNYFENKLKKGFVPFSSSEVKFLKKLPLEQWALYFDAYNDTFATLCVAKADKNPEWGFPETIKQQINNQVIEGNANAQFTLGLMYDLGIGEPQNYIPALYWYTQAAYKIHPGAMKNIGDIYYVHHNFRQALYWYKLAAHQGHARAQFNLGTLHYYGIEVPQNYVEAFYWYLCAALQGLSSAQFNVGTMYYKGHGVVHDLNLVIYWCKQAALQNHIEAQYNLGLLLLDDQSIYSDYDQSIKWLLAAARKGHISSQAAIKNFFIKKNITAMQTEENVFNSNNNGNHIYAMIKGAVQNLYEAHKIEALFNNPEEKASHYLRKKKFAIPILYHHYQKLIQFEEKVLEILEDLNHIGYLVDGWSLKDLTHLLEPRGEERYYETFSFCYYEESIINEKNYLSLGKEAVQKANKVMAIIKRTDEDLKSALSACTFLENAFKSDYKSLLGKAINFQYKIRSNKKVDSEKFNALLSLIKEQREEIFIEHIEGEKVSFKGMKNFIEDLESVRQLPEHLITVLRHSVAHRNELFAEDYPFLN